MFFVVPQAINKMMFVGLKYKKLGFRILED